MTEVSSVSQYTVTHIVLCYPLSYTWSPVLTRRAVAWTNVWKKKKISFNGWTKAYKCFRSALLLFYRWQGIQSLIQLFMLHMYILYSCLYMVSTYPLQLSLYILIHWFFCVKKYTILSNNKKSKHRIKYTWCSTPYKKKDFIFVFATYWLNCNLYLITTRQAKKKIYKSLYPRTSSARAHKIWDPTWFCCGVHVDLTNIVLLREASAWRGVYVIPAGVVKPIPVMLCVVK